MKTESIWLVLIEQELYHVIQKNPWRISPGHKAVCNIPKPQEKETILLRNWLNTNRD